MPLATANRKGRITPAKYLLTIQQHYGVTPDESVIDRELADVLYTEEKWRGEESERLHRLYDVIIRAEKLLHEVLLYVVIREHDLRTGDSGFFKENYKSDAVSLVDVLLMYRSLFHPADQEWLDDLRERVRNLEEYEEPLLEIEPLEKSFRDGVKPLGFDIERAR